MGAAGGVVDDRGPGCRVADDVLELARAVGRIGRDDDEAHAQAGHVARDEVGRARGGEDHAVAGDEPEAGQTAGAAGGIGLELAAPDPAAAGIVDLRAVGVGAPGAEPGGAEIRGVPGGRVEALPGRQVVDRGGHAGRSSASGCGTGRPGSTRGDGAYSTRGPRKKSPGQGTDRRGPATFRRNAVREPQPAAFLLGCIWLDGSCE
jgi:hypothetical protein